MNAAGNREDAVFDSHSPAEPKRLAAASKYSGSGFCIRRAVNHR